MIKLRRLIETTDIEVHLRERGVDFNRTHVVTNKKDGVAYFFLYNLSGKLVGYQRYNPSGSKAISNRDNIDLSLMKYRNYVTNNEVAVYGLESYDMYSKYLFIVEGIFDCIKIHNAGYPAIATLSNGVTKSTKEWLKTLPQYRIVITDNDEAGKLLGTLGNKSVTTPEPYKDLGEMPQEEVNSFLKSIIEK